MTTIIPQIVNVELTNRCNLECIFCDHKVLKETMVLGDFDDALLEKVLRSICGKGVFELGLVGLGEPLLDKHFGSHLNTVSRYANEFMRISLNTNGVALATNHARRILESAVNLVTISLNATNRQGYLNLMKRDYFNKIVDNIKNFLLLRRAMGKEQCNVSIQSMLCDMNDEQVLYKLLDGFIDERVKLYSRHVYNKPVMDIDKPSILSIKSTAIKERYPCWSMYSRVYIDIEGYLYPCTMGNDCYRSSSSLCLGNVHNHTVIDLFNGAHIQSARAAAELGKVPFEECEKCTAWSLLPNNFQYIDKHWQIDTHTRIRLDELDRKD